MSASIYDLFTKAQPAGDPFAGQVEKYAGDGPSRYGETALQREAEAVARAGQGVRNDTLNRAVFNLSQLIASGHLDVDRVHSVLTNAARACGLPDDEIQGTLRSGHKAGMAHPRAVAELEPIAEVHVLRPKATAREHPGQEAGSDGQAGEGDEDDPEALRAAVQEWVRESLPALDWHALWADDEEDEWILEPLVPARRLVALYSPPKVGKSLLTLEVAAAISCGREVLGVKPERAVKVLYVDFENDPKGDVRPRLQAMGYGPDDLGNLSYLSFPTLAALDSERGSMELMAAVDVYDAELVVIDTLSRSVAGEENENDTWLRFYRHTGLKLKQAKVACIRLDHAGKDVEKGQRGGSAKSGDVDAVWRMARVTEEMYTLTCEANRLPISEKFLTFERKALPHLHSAVSRQGHLAEWDAKVRSVIDLMDAASLPISAGRTRAREVVKGTGLAASNRVLEEAVKRRKHAAEAYVLDVREV